MKQESPGLNRRLLSIIGLVWGFALIFAVLLFAIYRLSSETIDAWLNYPFAWYHWLSLVAVVVFMAHSEGYMGFQKSFSPRVISRARFLYENPQLQIVLLAPLFLAGYIKINSVSQRNILLLTAGIMVLIFLIRFLPQPWRGIIDAGVVVGLSWGLVTIMLFGIRILMSRPITHSPEL